MNCTSCNDQGWVHLDFSDGTPDGVYNCDCIVGQALTWEGAFERHKHECPCVGTPDEYGPPREDRS